MGIYQRGKSYYIDVRDGKGRRIRKSVGRLKSVAQLVEKDLLVKIAKREYLGIFEADTTPFSLYASAWLEKKKAILARSTYGDYRSIWNGHLREAKEQHHGSADVSFQRRKAARRDR